MKNVQLICSIFILSGAQLIAQDLDTVYAVQIESSDYRFETSIEDYHTSENWTIWSMPMRNYLDTMKHQEDLTANYSYQNINDQNLSTAWITDTSDTTSLRKIEFEFHYLKYETYGSAYQFFGQINFFVERH